MVYSENPLSKRVYPNAFSAKVDFDAVREHIRKNCLFEIGQEYANNMTFHNNFKRIQLWLTQTLEFTEICLNHPEFNTNHYYDLRDELKRIEIPGTFMELSALNQLLWSLDTLIDVLGFFKKADNTIFPELIKLSSQYHFDKRLFLKGRDIIDENAQVRDTASDELRQIRKQLSALVSQRDKKLNTVYSMYVKNGYASDTGITIRHGRFVIPVFAAHKRKVNGFIHDSSATGQTVYIEPGEVFDINNTIADKKNEEKKEIVRILTAFTDELRSHLNELNACFRYLGIVDFLRAKALFSIAIDARMPVLQNAPLIDWKAAVHPLLLLKNQKSGKKTVPQDILLNQTQSVLIISGPNAGGKSVTLKTAGLLQYMLQCGIPIPVADGSKAGIFNKIFIDIGDEQSVENDLSTYSSHLHNMSYFIRHADPYTLFLIDEMGAGTEPQIGGALAEAILEKLYKRKAFGIITTHYLNLKVLPQKYKCMSNAAMLFDNQNLQPLYKLQSGEPGGSFAFEIAENMGLEKTVINNAKSKVNTEVVDYESYYLQAKEKALMLESRMQDIQKSDHILHETYEKYQKLLETLQDEKDLILKQARDEAYDIVDKANKKIEHIIKEIRESQAQKDKTLKLRKELSSYKGNLKPAQEKEKPVHDTAKNQKNTSKKKKTKTAASLPFKMDTSGTPFKEGDYVIIQGQTEVGQVETIKEKWAVVVFGHMKVNVDRGRLQRVIDYKPPKPQAQKTFHALVNISEKQKNFSPELDLRGFRTEEALNVADEYINTAAICGVKDVRILHGKGDGILRKYIQSALRNNELVESCSDEHIDRGGQGITVVRLK